LKKNTDRPFSMRKFILIFCMAISVSYTYGQLVGIGYGTSGFNVKVPIDSPLKVIARVNPEYSKLGTFVNVSAMLGGNLLVENYCELYLGLGAGTANTKMRNIIAQDNWFINLPLGLELHPFHNRRITFTIEAGPKVSFEDPGLIPKTTETAIGPSGLVEFSYYLW